MTTSDSITKGEKFHLIRSQGLSCLVLSALALGSLVISLKYGLVWLQTASPLLLTALALFLLRWIYLWQRKASYYRREKRRKAYPAEQLDIPEGIKKPEDYPGGKTIHDTQWKYIGRAVEAQGAYFASGITAAVLSPLALLLFSFQLLAFPNGGSWAIGLMLSEAGCLVLLIYLALTTRDPTSEWIENRVRTELLRREQYLFMAGVGPYLDKNRSDPEGQAVLRRSQIEARDTHALLALVPLQEGSGPTWLEALHHRGARELLSHSDCIERMESYLYMRIGKQLLWFANERRDCQENELLWSRLLIVAIMMAIGVAGLDILHMSKNVACGNVPDPWGHWSVAIGTLGIVLPPLGTAFLHIRAMYNFRGRSRIYAHERSQLQAYKGTLEALLLEAKDLQNSASHKRGLDEIDFDFRALVLRVEHSLSVEMEQWMLLMERTEQEVAP